MPSDAHRRRGAALRARRRRSASARAPMTPRASPSCSCARRWAGIPSHGLRRLPPVRPRLAQRHDRAVGPGRDRARRGLDADAGRPARARAGRLHARDRPRGRRARSSTASPPSRCATPGTPGASPTTPIAPAGTARRCWRSRTTPGAKQAVAPPGGARRRGCPRIRSRPAIPRPQRAAPRGRSRDQRRGPRQGAACCRTPGWPVPEAWVRDGLLQPLGGAKGFALGAAGGGARRRRVRRRRRLGPIPGPDDQGVFLLAFDPGRFGEPRRARRAPRGDARATCSDVPRRAGRRAAARTGQRRCRRSPLDPEARFELAPRARRSGSRRWPASSASRRSGADEAAARLVGEAAGRRAAVHGQAGAVDVRGLVGQRGTRSRRPAPPARATRPMGASSALDAQRLVARQARPAASSRSSASAIVPGSTVLQRMPWWA